MYTVAQVWMWPIPDLIAYIRWHLPPDKHFYANEFELRKMAIDYLVTEGQIYSSELQILSEPYYGDLYIAARGDTLEATARYATELIPAVNYLRFF